VEFSLFIGDIPMFVNQTPIPNLLYFIPMLKSISDIEALASLPRLNHLCIGGSHLTSSLSLLKGLKHLEIYWNDDVSNILPVTGGTLVGLYITGVNSSGWLRIAENSRYFHNLQYLDLVSEGC
jgi:hypothetical protein